MTANKICARCPLAPLAAATREALGEIRATAAKLGVQPPAEPEPVVRASASPQPALSPRERDVLMRIAQGWCAEETGGDLFISAATVRTHIQRVYKKLGVHDRAHAVHVAWQRGYLGKDEAA